MANQTLSNLKKAITHGFIILPFILFGCYMTFTGQYDFGSVQSLDWPQASSAIQKIDDAIKEIADSFGYKREIDDGFMKSYLRTKDDDLPDKYATLMGSDSTLTIALNLKEMYITIRDFDNDFETPFMIAVKQAIETKLYEITGFNITFRRAIEPI